MFNTVIDNAVETQAKNIVRETERIENVFSRSDRIQQLLDSFGDKDFRLRVYNRVCVLLTERNM